MGLLSAPLNATPNRKSFQMLVNCQISVTIRIGVDIGSTMRQKMRQKPAPSMRAALTSSSRNGDVVVAEEQRGAGHAGQAVHQHQPADRAGQAQTAQHLAHRQQHHLERHEHAKQHEAKQQLAAPELPHAQHVAVDGTPGGRDQHRRHHHHHRVPEVGLQAPAVDAGAGGGPGQCPGLKVQARWAGSAGCRSGSARHP